MSEEIKDKTSKAYKKRKIKEITETNKEDNIEIADSKTTVEQSSEVLENSAVANALSGKYQKLAKKDQMVIDVKMHYGAAMVSLFLNQLNLSPNNVEFEIRLGETINNVFHSGVASEYFNQMLQLVCASVDKEQITDTFHSITYYYPKGVRSIQKLGSDQKTKEEKPIYERGGVINRIDFVHVEQCGLYDLRFSLKNENQMTSAESDEFFSKVPRLNSVRFKSRRSCVFEEFGFRLDFTEAWVAKTEDQVIKLKQGIIEDSKAHTFEIELEILKTAKSVDAKTIFQQAIQLLGQGAPGVLYLAPAIQPALVDHQQESCDSSKFIVS